MINLRSIDTQQAKYLARRNAQGQAIDSFLAVVVDLGEFVNNNDIIVGSATGHAFLLNQYVAIFFQFRSDVSFGRSRSGTSQEVGELLPGGDDAWIGTPNIDLDSQ